MRPVSRLSSSPRSTLLWLILGLAACGPGHGPSAVPLAMAAPAEETGAPPATATLAAAADAPGGIATDHAPESDDPDAGGLPATFAGEAVCEAAGATLCLPRRYVLTLRADGTLALRVQELNGPLPGYGDLLGRWRQDTPGLLQLWLPPPVGALSAAYSPPGPSQPARLWLPLGPGHPLAVLWRAEHAAAFEAETILTVRVLPHVPGTPSPLLRDCVSGLVMATRAGELPPAALVTLAGAASPLRLAGRVAPYLGSPGNHDATATATLAVDHLLGPAPGCLSEDK